jgi:hypothetical protein
MSRFIRIVSVAAFVLSMCTAAWGAGLRIVPSSPLVKPGDDFYFDIVAEGIPASGLGGVQFRLAVTPSTGAANSVSDLGQTGTNDIAFVTPLLISPATTGRSGIGDFFWNGKGTNGILVMDNESLQNGSALFTYAHTSGAQPLSGSGSVARFAARVGSGVKAERLDIGLSDVMLMDGGPSYVLDYVSGTSIQLRCVAKVPALAGLSLTAAQSAIASANLTLGSVYQVDNQNGLRPLNVVLEQSSAVGSELDCRAPINVAVNVPPAEPANLAANDKVNDESGTVLLSWTPSASGNVTGYRIYSAGVMLKQLTAASANGTEIPALANAVVTRLRLASYDTYGNESAGIYVDAMPIDDVPPVITLNGISEGGYYRTDITPQVSVADASPVTWSATLNGNPFSIAPVTGEGSYTLTITAVDQAGNRSNKTVSFVVDKTAPVISVANIAENAFYKASVNPTIAVSDTNLKNSNITLDGQPYVSGTTVNTAGNHILQVSADDLAGNSASQTIRFTIDVTPPVLSVSTMSDGSYTNNEVLNIAGMATDDTAIKELAVNGTAITLLPDGSFSHALILVAGANRIEITATDQAGNSVNDIRIITLDQNAPIIDITSPADNSKTATALATLTGTVDETATVTVKLKDVFQNVTRNINSFTAELVLLPGSNTIEVIATDQAGNKSTAKRTVIYDDQKPSIAITSPSQDIRTKLSVMAIQGTVSDLYTAVSVTVEMDGQTYNPPVANGQFSQSVTFNTEKSYAIVVTATNEAGTSTTVQRNVIFDITPPALSIDPISSPTNQTILFITGTMEADTLLSVASTTATIGPIEYPTPTTWRTTMSNPSAGENNLVATATDAAGNVTNVTCSVFIDTTLPIGSVLINGGAGFTSSSHVSLSLAASDTTSVSQMQFSNEDQTWSISEAFVATKEWDLTTGDGRKQISVRFRDNAGNWSEIYSAVIVLDTVAPVINLLPTAGIYRTPQTVQIASSEAAAIHCTTDGSFPSLSSPFCTSPLNIAVTTTVNILANDAAGNQSRRSDTYIIDATPPDLHVSTLADGSFTNNAVLNVSGTVNDTTGIKELTINGTSVPVSIDGSFSHAVVLASGANTIKTIATDLAGNQSSDTRTLTLDQRAPLLIITAPADNSKTGASLLTVIGTVDETSVVTVKLGNSIQIATSNATSFSADLNLVPGINTVEIIATDRAGNTSSQKRTIVYDDQTPSLAVTVPVQDIRTNQATLLLKGTASDPYTAVMVAITVNGQTYTPSVVDGQFEQFVSFNAEKIYTITVIATNEVGRSTTTQRNVIYDITSPALTINPVITPTVQTAQTVTGNRENGLPIVVTCPTATVGTVAYPTDTTWSASLTDLKLGDNIISVASSDLAGNTTTLSTKIAVTEPISSIFSYAVFANKSISLSGSSLLDSYVGNPSSYVKGQYRHGNVGINSTQLCGIKLTGGTMVYGSAQVGVGGSSSTIVCTSIGTSVTGGSGTLPVSKNLAPIPAPTGYTSLGALSLSGVATKTLTTGTYRYSSITLGGSGKLNTSGQVILIVDGNISLSGAANLVVTSGSVVIYANGTKFDVGGGALVNMTQNPSNLIIYGSSTLTSVNLSGGTSLHGLIHAPAAAVKISGSQQTFGAIIGNTVDLSGATSVHYPESL